MGIIILKLMKSSFINVKQMYTKTKGKMTILSDSNHRCRCIRSSSWTRENIRQLKKKTPVSVFELETSDS